MTAVGIVTLIVLPVSGAIALLLLLALAVLFMRRRRIWALSRY